MKHLFNFSYLILITSKVIYSDVIDGDYEVNFSYKEFRSSNHMVHNYDSLKTNNPIDIVPYTKAYIWNEISILNNDVTISSLYKNASIMLPEQEEPLRNIILVSSEDSISMILEYKGTIDSVTINMTHPEGSSEIRFDSIIKPLYNPFQFYPEIRKVFNCPNNDSCSVDTLHVYKDTILYDTVSFQLKSDQMISEIVSGFVYDGEKFINIDEGINGELLIDKYNDPDSINKYTDINIEYMKWVFKKTNSNSVKKTMKKNTSEIIGKNYDILGRNNHFNDSKKLNIWKTNIH